MSDDDKAFVPSDELNKQANGYAQQIIDKRGRGDYHSSLKNTIARAWSHGFIACKRWFLDAEVHPLREKVASLEKQISILTNPSDGRCMSVAHMRDRIQALETELEKMRKQRG